MQPTRPAPPSLLFRNDTILGVCEAIGQDFGFHPNWLRVALASVIYFAPVAVIGGYLALGAVVALSRWIAPDQLVPVSGTAQSPARHELLEAGIEVNAGALQLAA